MMGHGTPILMRWVIATSGRAPIACLFAQWPEARANLLGKEFRLFPGRIVPALVSPVVVDELVICALGPTPRGLVVLARKNAHRSRDGDVGGIVKIEVIFPIEASRSNC